MEKGIGWKVGSSRSMKRKGNEKGKGKGERKEKIIKKKRGESTMFIHNIHKRTRT